MNKRFLVALALAVVFGLLAIFVAQRLLQQQATSNRQREEADVVIATADIPLGTKITAQQVNVVKYSLANIPEGALSKKEAVVDRVSVTDIASKMPIIARHLAAPDSPAGLPGVLPPGFALSGNYVDVIVIMQPQTSEAKPVSKVILQNVRVLATGQQMQPRNDGKASLTNTVTLLVTPAQAERLKLAESEGKLQLSIRNSTDQVAERTPGATRKDVLNDPALEARALIGVRRGDTSARPSQTIAPLTLQTVSNPAATPKPTPTPISRTISVELIEGSKRSRVEVLK
jgi:pilus assembly protein CpaB